MKTLRLIGSVIVLAPSLVWTGCDRQHQASVGTSPTPPTATAPGPATSGVVRITVSGTSTFTAIGESAQLQAQATLADGSVVDVTEGTAFTSQSAAVVAITPSGLLTITGFGSTYVRAAYKGVSRSFQISATPAGTFTVTGRVRLPESGPKAGVSVREPVTQQSTVTNATGDFSFGALTANSRLEIEPAGYEFVYLSSLTAGATYDIPIQALTHLPDGGTLQIALAAHDVSYNMKDGICAPCRLVRLQSSTPGLMRLTVTWTEAGIEPFIWSEGVRISLRGDQTMTAAVPVRTGETIIYLGLPGPVNYSYSSSPPVQLRMTGTLGS